MDDRLVHPRGLHPLFGSLAILVAAVCLLAAVAAAPARAATTVSGGSVTFVTDPGQSKSMYVGGIAPMAASPATLRLTTSAWLFKLPIAGGSVDVVRSTGTVRTRGTIDLWGRETMSAWTVLSFSRLTATLGAEARMTGVDSQGKRRVLGTMDIGDATMKPFYAGGHRWLSVGHVNVRMSSWLRGELTDVFPGYEPSGNRLGTVSMKARLD
jgi:hypothetical protein